MTAKILIVDDERTTRMALCEAFRQKGYLVNQAGSGNEAISTLATEEYDVVILDLEMPGMNGTEVLAQAEEFTPNTAFIILTAHASTDTAIMALRSGAFDYLRKPSSLDKIFTAVTKAITKKEDQKRKQQAIEFLQQAMNAIASPASQPLIQTKPLRLRTADIAIDDRQKTASFKETPLDLTPIEYKLLCKLVENPDTVISYTELAWESHQVDVDEMEARSLLRTHVYRLSRKLGDKDDSPIQSVRGQGVILHTQTAIS
jgi:DNA-binding response OmpR family regulator